jgi:AAA family ATP:ADP antiporter
VKISNLEIIAECRAKFLALRTLGLRSAFLFINFFLIITALYQLKPASRSLFIEAIGSNQIPYAWIATALTMGVMITYYYRLVERHSRINLVLGTCLAFSGLLVIFRLFLNYPGPIVPFFFYVFVDILAVVLVEQFWSLTNSIYTTEEGKGWYGIVGTGGLAGGVIGGGLSAFLIKQTPLQTPDLLVTAAATLVLIFAITWLMGRKGLYCEVDNVVRVKPAKGGWRVITSSRYLMIIAAILLLTQLASPLIEYQFLNTVESSYGDQEARTAFLSMFLSLLGIVSIAVNIGLTPVMLRYFGAIGGLLVQPLLISLCSWGFMLNSTLLMACATKISDRGLSYSINRAAKELLYVPVDPVLIYQAKAGIDMFGFRVFKIFASVLILFFTQWVFHFSYIQLSWFTLGICGIWIALVLILRQEYTLICQESV